MASAPLSFSPASRPFELRQANPINPVRTDYGHAAAVDLPTICRAVGQARAMLRPCDGRPVDVYDAGELAARVHRGGQVEYFDTLPVDDAGWAS